VAKVGGEPVVGGHAGSVEPVLGVEPRADGLVPGVGEVVAVPVRGPERVVVPEQVVAGGPVVPRVGGPVVLRELEPMALPALWDIC